MRCPDCNRFVSYEDPPTVEANDTALDGESVTGNVRVVLLCGECGTELKETYLDLEAAIEHACEKRPEGSEAEFDVAEEWEGEGQSRMETTVQRGKHRGEPIRNPRYWTTYYGADLTASVQCRHCEATVEVHAYVEETASGFEELV